MPFCVESTLVFLTSLGQAWDNGEHSSQMGEDCSHEHNHPVLLSRLLQMRERQNRHSEITQRKWRHGDRPITKAKNKTFTTCSWHLQFLGLASLCFSPLPGSMRDRTSTGKLKLPLRPLSLEFATSKLIFCSIKSALGLSPKSRNKLCHLDQLTDYQNNVDNAAHISVFPGEA